MLAIISSFSSIKLRLMDVVKLFGQCLAATPTLYWAAEALVDW